MTNDVNPTQNPSHVPNGETDLTQDFWTEYQTFLESERQELLSPENIEFFGHLSEFEKPMDQRLVTAFQTMKDGLEGEWTWFLKLKGISLQSTAAPRISSGDDPLSDLVLKDHWLAEGRIWFLRRFVIDTTTDTASLAPRREAHAFAREQLIQDIDRAEKRLQNALTKLVSRFKRHVIADDAASMLDVTADFSQITKEINVDLLREFDRFKGQEKAIQPFVRRAMLATANAQAEALKQQAESEAAQKAAKTAREEAEAAQNEAESARNNEARARHEAQLARDEAAAAQDDKDAALHEAKLAEEKAQVAQEKLESAENKRQIAEDEARTAQDKADAAQAKATSIQEAAALAQIGFESTKGQLLQDLNQTNQQLNQAKTKLVEVVPLANKFIRLNAPAAKAKRFTTAHLQEALATGEGDEEGRKFNLTLDDIAYYLQRLAQEYANDRKQSEKAVHAGTMKQSEVPEPLFVRATKHWRLNQAEYEIAWSFIRVAEKSQPTKRHRDRKNPLPTPDPQH